MRFTPAIAIIVAFFAFCGIGSVVNAAEPTPASQPEANPVIPGNAADPHMAIFGQRYYLYMTHAGAGWSDFTAWSSPDLVNWKNEGVILRFSKLTWPEKITGHAWAPAAAERNGKYYFYFCARSRIGVAVSDSPAGPFKDALGKPLIEFRDDYSSIDPMAFIDDDGQAYLYWGAVQGKGRHLFVRKLNPDMISFDGPEQPVLTTDGIHIEGSFIVKRKGVYYFMWSTGGWNVAEGPDTYRVDYGMSDSPVGPFHHAKNSPMLSTDRKMGAIAPGHHAVVQYPGTDDWYIVYHVLLDGGKRNVWIDPLYFEVDGLIRKIVPTKKGVSPRPLPLAVTTAKQGPFEAGQDVTLKGTASTPADRIDLFANGKKIGSIAGADAAFKWEHVPAGFYRVQGKLIVKGHEAAASADICFDVR